MAPSLLRASLSGVKIRFVNGSDLVVATEVAKAIYQDFLPAALEQKRYVAIPEPLVPGHGLEKVQDAMDVSKKGVSLK